MGLNVHRETDALSAVKSEKKLAYWRAVASGEIEITGSEITIEYAKERVEYWMKQFEMYKARINEHKKDFEAIKNPLDLFRFVEGIIDTIKKILVLFGI